MDEDIRGASLTAEEAFRRGRVEGQIETRLNQHDELIHTLSQSVALLTKAVQDNAEITREVRDKLVADREERKAIQEALLARDQAEWTPRQRTATVVGAIAGALMSLTAIITLILHMTGAITIRP